MIHHLKTWPQFFDPVSRGEKPFEIRKNDRDFKKDDSLILEEWDPRSGAFTGRKIMKGVTYITKFEQKTGFCVMGISDIAIYGECPTCKRPYTEEEA